MHARANLRSALFVVGLCVACGFEVGPLQVDGEAATGGTSGYDRGSSASDTVDDPAPDGQPEASTGAADTSTSGGPPGDCCEPSEAAGCLDPDVAHCVCELDPHCCDSGWDELCVEEVSHFGCGACSRTTDASTACCTSATTSGCEDEAVQACVCAANAYCCHVAWDDKCVAAVEQLGCGSCDPDGLDAVDCCRAQAVAACDDPETSACVCAHDPYCCEQSWDEICVSGVEAYGCGTCGAGTYGTPGDCCAPQAGPGCGDVEAEACVCAFDTFCCQVSWDELCVDDAIELCGSCRADDGDRPE